MLHQSIRLSGLLLLTCFIACFDTIDKKLIIGQWTGTEWVTSEGVQVYTPEDASFTFDDKGNYTFVHQEHAERGKYFISNNQLYTTPDGGEQIMVKIVSLTAGQLIFEMNRGGTREQLTLMKTNISY